VAFVVQEKTMNIQEFFKNWNNPSPSMHHLCKQITGSYGGTKKNMIDIIGHMEIDKIETIKVDCSSDFEVGRRYQRGWDLTIEGQVYRVLA
jgi:hypothetical protein